MHFENLLFILLIAMAALLRLLATKAGAAKKGPQKVDQGRTITPKRGESIRRAQVESDEERIRTFLEALGQPTTSKPPPPIVPRTDIPPRPVAPVQPPGEMRPFSLPHRRLTSEERKKRRVILHVPPPAPAPVFEVRETTLSAEPSPPIMARPAEAYAIATEP